MKVFLIALALTAGALQAADCCNNCSCNPCVGQGCTECSCPCSR